MSSKSRKRRREAAQSRGPVTAEDKARNSRNACRHGLSNPHVAAELTCLYVEDLAEFVVMHEALDARTLNLLDRYETRLYGQFDRALRRFRDLRARPTAPPPPPPEENFASKRTRQRAGEAKF